MYGQKSQLRTVIFIPENLLVLSYTQDEGLQTNIQLSKQLEEANVKKTTASSELKFVEIKHFIYKAFIK